MDKKTIARRTSRQFNLVSAALAFLIWGGWAYYVNNDQGSSTGLISGITQGSASFIITLAMVHTVTWLYKNIPPSPLQLFLPAIITVSITASCLYSVHSLVGTPNIAYTIAPALSVAFMFCVFTCFKLDRLSSHNNHPN